MDSSEFRLTFISNMQRGFAADPTFFSAGEGEPELRRGLDVRVVVETDGGGPAIRGVQRRVELYGPGDVKGLDAGVVVRTDPAPDSSDFEPNFLPMVELAEPDLPWRFTVGRVADGQLRPWLVLVVLTPEEFDRDGAARDPLPVIRVTDPGLTLPDLEQSWAWAHCQSARPLETMGAASWRELRTRIEETPGEFLSRIICPRHLRPEQAYDAFLVPATEAGRRAGLGEEPAADGVAPAWDSDTVGPLALPFYFTWSFRTSERGSFEYLVELLEPHTLGDDIGFRHVHVEEPGLALPGLAEPVSFGGALRPARRGPPPASAALPVEFADALRDALDGVSNPREPDAERRREVGPPIYGSWHDDHFALDTGAPPWLTELNLALPRRFAAGIGAEVVRRHQEALMAAAWKQLAGEAAANEEAAVARFGAAVSARAFERSVLPLDEGQLIGLADSVLSRVKGSPYTLRRLVVDSRLPNAFGSAPFRRVSTWRGRLGRRLGLRPRTAILRRLNEGQLRPDGSPPAVPDGAVTLQSLKSDPSLQRAVAQQSAGADLRALVWGIGAAVLGFAALAALFAASSPWVVLLGLGGLVAAGASVQRARWERERARRVRRAASALPRAFEGVSGTPPRPDFALSRPGQPISSKPSSLLSRPPALFDADNATATAFRKAALGVERRLAPVVRSGSPSTPLDSARVRDKLLSALDPHNAIGARLGHRFRGAGLLPTGEDPLAHQEGAPTFPQPMYEPLRDLSQDHLLPGIEHVPPNTVTLLETDQAFVEAYMAGLNHEMTTELVWREHPAKRRATYFRQFWDVSGTLPPPLDGDMTEEEATAAREAWRASLHDIRPLHQWAGELGAHRPPSPTPREEQLVLLIRGELLRRYPTAIIYAQKARRVSSHRRLDFDDSVEPKTPVFRGTLPPDCTFLGFDLTAEEALGSADPLEDQGWFFVIQEQPTEPRFGLDVGADPDEAPSAWEELSWEHMQALAGPEALRFVDVSLSPALAADAPSEPRETEAEWGRTAADMASITTRPPVRVAVHACRMLS